MILINEHDNKTRTELLAIAATGTLEAQVMS